MHPCFLRALDRRPRFRCYGLDLLPLTLGHLFLLREYRSPFVSPEDDDKDWDVGLGDILLAAFICSQSYADGRLSLESPKLERFIQRWGYKCRKMEVVPQYRQFLLYLKHYFAAPIIDSREYIVCEAPYEWRLISMLMTECGMSFEAGLEMPVARAVALWAANGERLGKFKLARSGGQFERQLFDSFRQQKAIDQKILEDAKAAGLTFTEYVNKGLLKNSLN